MIISVKILHLVSELIVDDSLLLSIYSKCQDMSDEVINLYKKNDVKDKNEGVMMKRKNSLITPDHIVIAIFAIPLLYAI